MTNLVRSGEMTSLLYSSFVFQVYSRDITRFTETYEEACNLEYANHEKILVGLFLGLTEKAVNRDTYQQFLVQLIPRFDELPNQVETALARVGLRLIKRYSDNQKWQSAVEIVEAFHTYSIRYANAGEGFGTQLETKDNLSFCEIADLCCRTCISGKKPTLLLVVFSHCSHCINFEELTGVDKGIYLKLAIDIITLLNKETPGKAVGVLVKTHEIYEPETFKHLLNKTLEHLLNSKSSNPKVLAGQINELDEISKDKKALFPDTIRRLVNFYSRNNLMEDARRYFDEGRKINIYQETFFNSQPYLSEIKTGMKWGEMYLIIESHMVRLMKHPLHGSANPVPTLPSPLELVVAPGTDVDGDQYLHILDGTMREIGRVLAKEFSPPIQVLATSVQVMFFRLGVYSALSPLGFPLCVQT